MSQMIILARSRRFSLRFILSSFLLLFLFNGNRNKSNKVGIFSSSSSSQVGPDVAAFKLDLVEDLFDVLGAAPAEGDPAATVAVVMDHLKHGVP